VVTSRLPSPISLFILCLDESADGVTIAGRGLRAKRCVTPADRLPGTMSSEAEDVRQQLPALAGRVDGIEGLHAMMDHDLADLRQRMDARTYCFRRCT
jgi:hypothetical protein